MSRTRAHCRKREPLPDKGNGSLLLSRHGAFMGLFVKTTYADTCVGLDVLYYLLVVVVGGGRGKVKLTECPTLHVSEYPVDSVQQLELLHVAIGSQIGH
ncbi:hypothetical protein, partial [uncultured Muribaculum sp.]|uniref:hypothetical protein n=1 Tax=uncultured Muribaculum sp. TaxID=1918613 RepID=UPI0025B63BF1